MATGVSPEAIEKADFPTSLRGYDKDEVDAYLRVLAAEHRRLRDASRAAKATVDKPYHHLGEDVGELLQHAKDSADRLKHRAEEDATRVREEAKKAAKETREKAKESAKQVKEAADYEASERLKDSQRRVEELRKVEAAINERLDELRTSLYAVLSALDKVAPAGEQGVAPAGEQAAAPAEEPADEAPELIIEEPRAEGDVDEGERVVVIDAEGDAPVSAPR